MIHIKKDFFWVGTSQNFSTEDTVTSPEDSEIKKHSIDDMESLEHHVTDPGPGTTEVHTTAEIGTPEDYGTAHPEATGSHFTADARTPKDNTIKDLGPQKTTPPQTPGPQRTTPP